MKLLLSTLCVCVALAGLAVAQVAPYTENFDSGANGTSSCTLAGLGTPPAGWTDGGGTSVWTVWSGGTTSGATGPTADHTSGSGRYMYCETSGCSGEFLLLSPNVDCTALTNPTLVFWRHMFGATTGTLEVQEWDGVMFNTLAMVSGNQGDSWQIQQVSLTPLAGFSQIRFRYTGNTGFTGDTAIDDVSWQEPPTNIELAPEFETNSPESAADVNGQQSRTVVLCGGAATGTLNLNSTLVGNVYDWLVSLGGLVGKSQGAYVSPNSQTLNVPFNFPFLLFANQSAYGSAIPHPGSVVLPFTISTPTQACTQQFVFDAGAADGYHLSQGVQVTTVNSATFAGPATDDSSVQATFCSPIPFCGTSYTSCFIISNARITFGAADTDFSPTVAEALTDAPSFGAWTDLNPTTNGTITYTIDGPTNSLTANYNGVAYFSEAGSMFNLTLGIDGAGVCTVDVSGVPANPLTTITTSDAMFLGLSCGSAGTATDPGITTFTAPGSGGNAVSTDMIYDFVNFATATPITPGLIDSITNLQTGNGLLTFTPGANPGDYTWTGM